MCIVIEEENFPNGDVVALELHEQFKDTDPFVVRYNGNGGLSFSNIAEAVKEYEYQCGAYKRQVKRMADDIREAAAVTPTVLAKRLIEKGYRKCDCSR